MPAFALRQRRLLLITAAQKQQFTDKAAADKVAKNAQRRWL
ncbi:hypothetical protein QMK19_36275 [Streptomyces sp. H10-C2]|nr:MULTISPECIES: hypothetical protein [unclassified Streptomyces]MDJ0346380.1 hypothetical protein [Streptomyces sp. PH10-H1]MDJ0374930.1 hypothetical protein [Streptomyces sp. H10-C2]